VLTLSLALAAFAALIFVLVRCLTGTAFTNYSADATGNLWLRATAQAAPATVYLALYTVLPTDSGGGTEVTGGSYARQAIAWAAPSHLTPSGSQWANSGAITFPTATANWGTVVGFGIFDALSAGNLIFYGNLNANQIINSGGQFTAAVGAFTVTID